MTYASVGSWRWHMVEPSFDHSTFTRNRDRLLDARVSRQFFDEVVMQADQLALLSDEHFTVDGTRIEAAASLKSFRPRDEPPSEGGGKRNHRGEPRQSLGGLS